MSVEEYEKGDLGSSCFPNGRGGGKVPKRPLVGDRGS